MVGDNILLAAKGDVDRIRNTVKFILGLVEGAEEVEQEELVLADRAVLHRLHKYITACDRYYEGMEYSRVSWIDGAAQPPTPPVPSAPQAPFAPSP